MSRARIDWGEPNSPLRIFMVGGLIVELRKHLGPDVENDREEMISGDSARLDGLERLIESWKRKETS